MRGDTRARWTLASLAAMVIDLRNYIAQEALEDGTAVTVRAIRREDQDALTRRVREPR
jgi:hypothetical protein